MDYWESAQNFWFLGKMELKVGDLFLFRHIIIFIVFIALCTTYLIVIVYRSIFAVFGS